MTYNNLKLIVILIFSLALTQLNAQTYNISTYSGQTVTTCSGTFTDMGGVTGGYSGTQDDSITFCPSTPGAAIELDFTQFDIAATDALMLYDGPNTSANLLATFDPTLSPVGMLISASILNPTGCLTLHWTSSGVAPGWEAAISCGLPCQNYAVTLQSSTPPFHLDTGYYYIDICPGDPVTLTATGDFGLNDSIYHQSNATTQFIWDMGNYQTDTTQTITAQYDTIAGYDVRLIALDSNGCLSNQIPKIRVRLSTPPDLTGTRAIRYRICQYDTTSLYGESQAIRWNASTSLNHAGLTYLPDGSGVSYVSTLLFTVFDPTDVIQSPLDIEAIKATLEHSYLGDLNIKVTCPNGQNATLKSYPGGGGTYLGEPIDGNSQPVPGIGYEYVWSALGTSTMLNAVGNYTYNYTNASGAALTGKSYLPPSTSYPANATITTPQVLQTYLPEDPYNALIGCPLNGAWEITVTDNLSIDNGFIFAWGIDFAPHILPNSWDYTPAIDTETWNNSTDIITNNGDNIIVRPENAGSIDYTFTVEDNFGCEYDTTLTINVLENPEVFIGNDTILCKDKVTDLVIFDATSSVPNSTYLWNNGNANPTNTTNTTGDYSVTVSVDHGGLVCSNSDTIHLDAYDMAKVDFGNDTCIMGDQYVLYAGNRGHNPPFIYLWNNGSTGDSLVVTESGYYSVTVAIDPSSPCTIEEDIKLSIFNKNFLGADQEFCYFEEATVSIPNDGELHDFNWKLDGETPIPFSEWYFTKQYMTPGDHKLTLQIDNGCYDEVNLTSIDCQITVPNVITPNGDGKNDVFHVEGLENFNNSIMYIYNRWGKKVYNSDNYDNQWGGENLTDGVYFYHLIITVMDEDVVYKGSLTIMR